MPENKPDPTPDNELRDDTIPPLPPHPDANSSGQEYPQAPGGQSYPQQGYPAPGQGYPQQGYPAPGQSYPQQGYPAPGQSYPQQGYPAPGQSYPQQGYPAPGQMPQGPYGQPYVEQKSRLAAGLLGIFLGGMGIHRFYLGHIGLGVIQLVLTLLTFGFASLWGFIEGIMILCGAQSFQRDAKGVPLRP
ncbi:TM2 domain-containing membrane protein YozV [Arthrobacter sp. UYP6]|uniref:TM2 domain-containing protein n=1 Tax=Arthrobacter sp. UYP6 TaxID=1756378 RepID=UPI00339B164B